MLWDCSQHSHIKGGVSCGRNLKVEEQFVGNAGREGVLVGLGTVWDIPLCQSQVGSRPL